MGKVSISTPIEITQPTQVYSPYDISDLTKRCNYTLSSQLAMGDCVAQNGTLHGLRDDLAVLFNDLDKVIAALEDRHQGGYSVQ